MNLAALLVLAFVTLQRLSELVIARRNTAALVARGAYEVGRAHYPAMVVMHAAWLAGLWWLGWNVAPNPWWLALYALLQVLRLWTLATLGRRWTTRILVLPGETLVRAGPYRFVSHPNYVVVVGEMAVLPLVFGLAWYALLFSLLNALVLLIRIRTENAALRAAAESGGPRSRT